jgi:hypothetical protein
LSDATGTPEIGRGILREEQFHTILVVSGQLDAAGQYFQNVFFLVRKHRQTPIVQGGEKHLRRTANG